MHVALSAIKWQFAMAYNKDFVKFSSSAKQHIDHVSQVLRPLRDAGATVELKKCSFIAKTIDYLAPVIRPSSFGIASHTMDAIRALNAPRVDTNMESCDRMTMPVQYWSCLLTSFERVYNSEQRNCLAIF